jgi:acetyltransferase
MVLVAEELPRAAGIDRKLRNFSALDDYIATNASKPIVCFSPVTSEQNEYIQGLQRDLPHIAWLRDLNKTLRVASGLGPFNYPPLRRAVNGSAAREALESLTKRNLKTRSLDEQTSKDILRTFGIQTPREIVLPGWGFERVASAAATLKFPVVVKVVCAAVAHKSDAGLVILNVTSKAELTKAYDHLSQRCGALGLEPEGILVAEQMSGGIEVVIGLHRDAEVGPVVMFGAGGILLELMRDVAFGPPGLDAARARDMIASTRVAKLLDGYRGAAPCDKESLVDALVAMGAMAAEVGDLVESAEINPLLVRPDGVFALDALIAMREPPHS